eukprot:CAMPEP_0119120808 /NCGR_PEP_ID=MMETSP1310-20130426/1703_1 /TAXON_ID=464262 /ORGANISM="Genus nov. species nov., Strain RCC2339" /LENGTH=33 /DNA_ID= /DNA_START= /DNA_END= /DNA_ORIENTATION=
MNALCDDILFVSHIPGSALAGEDFLRPGLVIVA